MTERSFLGIVVIPEKFSSLSLCRVGGKEKSKTSSTRGGVSTVTTSAFVPASRSKSQSERQSTSDDRFTIEQSDH